MEIAFYGSGAVRKRRDGGLVGGVPDPQLGSDLQFEVWREVRDEEGLWNPAIGERTVDGGFQISIQGTSAGYRELARYLLAIAELDTAADPDFHEHHEISSADSRTRLHVIVRKRLDNRHDEIRIISARPATRRERRGYEEGE
ncbi:MAG: hypothetical protein M3303_08495 [Gemmatimonadota bacterium]|nr:hypothetical protein [Gemmatimonadota bacterium]